MKGASRNVVVFWSLLLVAGTPGLEAFSLKNPKPDKAAGNGLGNGVIKNRRELLVGLLISLSSAICISPKPARALGEGEQRMVFKQKPTAPIGALLPALQQRLLLEASLDFCKKGKIERLKEVIPRLDESCIENVNGSKNMKVLKKYNPAQVLRGDVVRATMNLYQTNLNYNNLLSNPSDAFTVTDPSWKKSYIRANNGLPDLQTVIGADIDMRQLLRNQVQQKIDDAAAELYASDRDNEELEILLEEAAQNFDLWLDRIRTGDVRDALQGAMEGKSVKVYDTYTSGFLPPQATILP